MATLEQIIKGEGTTLVVHNHLSQITGFVRGGGVEFLPRIDQDGLRKSFLDGLAKDNKLRSQINCMVSKLLTAGKILLYLRPIPGSYRIHWYAKEQYECTYDKYGEIQDATIIYGYKRKDQQSGQLKDRWVRARLSAETVEVGESDSKPSFAPSQVPTEVPQIGPNRLGFVPCIEVLNPTPASPIDGVSDFAAVRDHIEAHDEMTEAIVEAIIFFCQSPILTDRDANEVSEAIGLDNGNGMSPQSSQAWEGHQSPSEAGGFRDVLPGGWSMRRKRRRLKRVIGGIDPSEYMFQQLGVSGVSGELVQYTTDYERQLREAMGGILERGIESATETRVVYGKVAATARDKQVALFENGLCKLLSMALLAEESRFTASGGMEGLPPQGNREVYYRIAPMFMESTNETLQKSIVSRNLMRQGVNAKEALKFVFPDKSENELDIMVGSGGLPTEYLEAAMRIMSQLIAMRTQDPMTGLESPVSDPATGLPLYQTLVPFITQSLDYGSQFRSTAANPSPAIAERDRNAARAAVAAVAAVQRRPELVPTDNQSAPGTADPSESLPDPGTTRAAPGFFARNFPTFSNAISRIGSVIGR
jgi:hypothetical protein